MKLANKQGTITKLSGNRRNPYMVRTPIVFIQKKQKYGRIIIGYARTKKQAELMLLEYNKKNLNLSDVMSYTFKDLLDSFIESKQNEVTEIVHKSYINTIEKHLYPLFEKRIDEVKYKELQSFMNNASFGTGVKIKRALLYVYQEAIKLDIIDRNYAELLTLKNKKDSKVKKVLSYDDINLIWNLYKKDNNNLFLNVYLIQLYTGCRVNEVLKLNESQIFFEDMYIKTGSKTDAGKNRLIPIHHKILPVIKNALDSKILPNKSTVYNFVGMLKNYNKKINLNFTSHELRHTFITELQKKNASVLRVKKIVGHKSTDITDGVYTHLDIKDLKDTIELIGY